MSPIFLSDIFLFSAFLLLLSFLCQSIFDGCPHDTNTQIPVGKCGQTAAYVRHTVFHSQTVGTPGRLFKKELRERTEEGPGGG